MSSPPLLDQLLQWVSENAGNLAYLIIGSILTLLVSWFVESRRRKSERVDERRERIYAPLFDELARLQGALTNYGRTGTELWGEFTRIKKEHIAYMVPRKLRAKLTSLIETDVEDFDKQLMALQGKYENVINAEITQALVPIGATPGTTTTVVATSDSNVAYLTGLAIYLARGSFPGGDYRSRLEAAFQAVKARSKLSQNNVEELFAHYLDLYQSDEEYKTLNKQRERALSSVNEIRAQIAKGLEV